LKMEGGQTQMTPLLTRGGRPQDYEDSPVSQKKVLVEHSNSGTLSLAVVGDSSRAFTAVTEACDEGPGLCALLITLLSCLLIIVSLPLSLCCVIKVVQEYERAVIFRLGRLLSGGARGPGQCHLLLLML